MFDQDARLTISCLWRLTESGRIRLTSDDDGQQFGLPAPVEAAAELSRILVGAVVEAVQLREGVLDVLIRFSTGQTLKVIPISSGYEAWIASKGSRQVIAVGGGELAIWL
jgi:hypothetical protein